MKLLHEEAGVSGNRMERFKEKFKEEK